MRREGAGACVPVEKVLAAPSNRVYGAHQIRGAPPRSQDIRRVTARLIVGWKESCDLPDLGITGLPVKIDTGARTSALHVLSATPFEGPGGAQWIRFEADHAIDGGRILEAPAAEPRTVRSSNGESETRLAIRTMLHLGPMHRRIDITLTNRDDMRFPMLIGRTSLRRGVLVDALSSFLVSPRVELRGASDAEDADISNAEEKED